MGRAALVLRHVLAAALTCALFPQFVNAAEQSCRSYKGDRYFIEWIESGGQRGVRLVILDPRWKFGELGHHATARAACESCPAGQLAQGVLWLSDLSRRDLEELLAVDSIADHMAGFPYEASGAKFLSNAQPMPISFSGRDARARAVRIEFRDGRIAHVIALAVVDGCASLFGILHVRDGTEVAVGDVAAIDSAIGFELYKPSPDPEASDLWAEAENRTYVPPHWSLKEVQRALKGDKR
jgi:hypothetical protein